MTVSQLIEAMQSLTTSELEAVVREARRLFALKTQMK